MTQQLNNNIDTNLMQACYKGDIKLIKLLLAQGADPDLVNGNGDTLLTAASSKGLTEIVELLLPMWIQEDKENVVIDGEGNCYRQDKFSVDINHVKETSGKTALMEACENGYTEIVRNLLYFSADTSPVDKCGYTAFTYAYKNNHAEIAKLLLEESITINRIIYIDDYNKAFFRDLCKDDYIDIVTFLLKNDIDLHKNDKTGHTTLMYAAQDNYIDIVKLLLKDNVHINKQNNNGHTALIYAAKNDNTDIAALLINNGADINIANEDGNTALIQACRYNSSIELIKLLLDKGADVNTVNKHGKTALSIARDNGFDDIIKLLSEYPTHYQKD